MSAARDMARGAGLVAALAVVVALATLPAAAQAAVRLVPAEYPTIQAAVDAAAAGDEILVAAGTYEEQVVITTDLVLTGAGSGQTIIKAPLDMPWVIPPLDYNAVVFALQPATTVIVRDLTVDGDGRGRSDTRFVGVMFERVGGEVRRLDIRGVHDTPVGTSASGIGLYQRSDPGDGLEFLVSDVDISGFQKSGFACFGSGCEFTLERMNVDAGELYSDAVQNACELANATRGVMTDCTVSGTWYDGAPTPNTTACGILFYYAERWTVTGLVADGNQTGVYAIATDLELDGLSITGHTQPLQFNYGIVASGPGSAILAGTTAPGRPLPLEDAPLPLVSPLGTEITLTASTITGLKLASSIGLVQFSSLEEVALDVSGCTFADWDLGIIAAEAGAGWVTGRVRATSFTGQVGAAVFCDAYQACDARGNNWDDPSGPYEPVRNPGGLGQAVSGNVLFDPWLEGNVVCTPLPLYIAAADGDGTDGHAAELAVRYLGADTEPVYGFSAELTWNPGKLTATAADVSRPDDGPFATAVLFQVLPVAGGLRVDAALGGSHAGTPGGDLFKIRLHLVGTPDYTEIPVGLTIHQLRDGTNNDIAGYLADDGLVIGDIVPPAIGKIALTNTTLSHTDELAKNGDILQFKAPVSDGDPLFGAAGIRANQLFLIGPIGYNARPAGFDLDTADWTAAPAQLTPSDGPVAWTVTAVDPAGNAATRADTIWADNTPPGPVTGLTASAGADRIDLIWDDPVGLDANFRQVVIRGSASGDYPLYSSSWPDPPGAPDVGDLIFSGAGTTSTASYPADGSGRDVVALQAFAVDMVGLVSPPGAGAVARNYLLADVAPVFPDYDHGTDGLDMGRLDGTWGLATGEPSFDAECDVGPTDTGTVTGLPRPDGMIDLDDLMIFAERYGAGPELDPAPVATVTVSVGWSEISAGTWALTLLEPCPELKGMRVGFDLPDGVTASVGAGALLAAQDNPVYLRSAGPDVDATWAVLGATKGVAGAGELLRITTSLPITAPAPVWDARSTANTPLPVQDAVSAVPAATMPQRFALHGNHPNPFNPATRIVFDLPGRMPVRLVIYGIDGRRIATLVDGPLPGGRHEVPWRGRDGRGRSVAAGIYLYKLEAGPRTATGKMNLVR